jgi:hypothetical protein
LREKSGWCFCRILAVLQGYFEKRRLQSVVKVWLIVVECVVKRGEETVAFAGLKLRHDFEIYFSCGRFFEKRLTEFYQA